MLTKIVNNRELIKRHTWRFHLTADQEWRLARGKQIQRELKMQRRTLMKAALTALTMTALQATTALAENTVLKIGHC